MKINGSGSKPVWCRIQAGLVLDDYFFSGTRRFATPQKEIPVVAHV